MTSPFKSVAQRIRSWFVPRKQSTIRRERTVKLQPELLEERIQPSHFRGGAIIPSVNATGLLTITSVSFWRPTSVASTSPTVTGSHTPLTQTSSTTDISDTRFTKVTQVFTTQLQGGSGLYSIQDTGGNRVGGVINASESTWDTDSAILYTAGTANTPITFNFSSVQVEVVRGFNYSDSLGAIAGPGLTLSYNQNLNTSINSQPPGFTIGPSTGFLFIPAANTATYGDNTANAGADYAFSGNILASDGSFVEFDWLFDAVNTGAVNNAPNVNDASTSGDVGDTITHTFTGSDPDGNALTWSFVGLLGPGGASPVIPPTFNTSTQFFSWNTTGSVSGTWIAQVRATDPSGLSDVGSLTIALVANQPPTARPGGPYSVPEGGSVVLSGAASTDTDGTIVSYEWDFNYNGVTFDVDATGVSPTFSAAGLDNPLSRTIGLRVTDDDGAKHTANGTVNVTNVAPLVNADPPPINENQSAQLTGDFTDPGVADTHIVTIDWDDPNTGVNSVFNLPATTSLAAGQTYTSTTSDGAVLTIQTVNTSTGRVDFASAHQYLDDGVAPGNGSASDVSTINIIVTDDDGAVGSDITTVTVNNVAPEIVSLSLTSSNINEDDSTTLSGSFTDPGTLDVHTVTINWGDGSTNTVMILPVGSRGFSAGHTYLDDGASPGNGTAFDVYPITVTVSDDDGGSDTSGGGSSFIRVAGIGSNSGNQATNVVFSSGDLAGTVDRSLSTAAFNALTPAQLRASYDVLLITWASDPGLNLNWTTRLLPFMQLGGDVLWEDPNNTGDISAIISVIGGSSSGSVTVTPVPVLTDGISGSFANNHIAFGSWDPALSPFLNNGSTVGLYGTFGSGRIVLTGPDQDFHSSRPSDQYNFLVNELEWVSADGVSVTVNNVDPTLSGLSATSILENGTTTLSGTIADVGTLDKFTVEIDWDGDNIYDDSYTNVSAGVFNYTHQYLDDNPTGTSVDNMPINVRVTDDDTGDVTGSTTVEVTNVDPTLSDLSATPILENGTTILTGNIADVGTLDTFTIEIDWDNDGSYDESHTGLSAGLFSYTHQYLDDNPTATPVDNMPIKVRVTDDDTGDVTGSTTVEVTNVDPVIDSLSATSVDEDGTVHLTGTYHDVGTLDTHKLTIDWGEGAPETVVVIGGAFDITHQYLDDNPTGSASDIYTIGVTLTDDDTGTDTASTTTTITNVAPEITSLSLTSTSISEGSSTTLTINWNDPGTQDTYTVTINWGDDSDPTIVTVTPSIDVIPVAAGIRTLSVTHLYADDGQSPGNATSSDVSTISVRVDDDDLGSDSGSIDVTVNNVAPTLSAILGVPLTDDPDECNTTWVVTGQFSDPGTDSYQFEINWGDGNIDTFNVPGPGFPGFAGFVAVNVPGSASHTYTAFGTYTISVTVRDDDGGVTSAVVGVVAVETTAAIVNDPVWGKILDIHGTDFADHITVNQNMENGVLVFKVHTNSWATDRTYAAAGVTMVRVHACDGDDHVDISTGVDVRSIIFGEGGNDHLNGGKLGAIIIGGDGDDMIVGGQGKDILIGGKGADRIVGNNDDDILIAGYTSYDANDAALKALAGVWNTTGSYPSRIAAVTSAIAIYHLITDGSSQTVFSDKDVDQLTGSAGSDLFFADTTLDEAGAVKDIITDLKSETALDIDLT